MRNTTKLFGIIAIVAVIGLSFASCGDNGGGGYTPTAGLYRGTLPNLVAADRVADVAANNVAAAVAYVNDNVGTFTLLVGAPVTVTAAQSLANGVHLTVAGIGGRQTITRQGTGILFNLSGVNRSLTLGDNITLTAAANNTHLVQIAGGTSFTMNAGAQITGNTTAGANSAAVNVTGEGSTFTMNGGEIFGNTATGVSSGGGVRVATGALFVMNAGAVIRNNDAEGDSSGGGVLLTSADSIFRMLGGEIRGNGDRRQRRHRQRRRGAFY